MVLITPAVAVAITFAPAGRPPPITVTVARKGRRGTAATPHSPPGLPSLITCSPANHLNNGVQRQRSGDGALCAPYPATPCWIPFSSAVPGFALRNRSRVVRDLCFTVVEGPLCARSPIYFLIQRQRSPSAHLVRRRGATPCSVFILLVSKIRVHHMNDPLRVGGEAPRYCDYLPCR